MMEHSPKILASEQKATITTPYLWDPEEAQPGFGDALRHSERLKQEKKTTPSATGLASFPNRNRAYAR